MSESTGITCKPILDVKSILQPMMMMAAFKGEEFPIDALVDVYLQDAIVNSLLQNVTLPEEFRDLGEVICLQIEMGKVKTLMAVLRGEKPPEESGIEKVIELVANLQLLSALSQAFGGAAAGTSGATAGG